MSRRNFLGMAATGVAATAMGSNVLFGQDGSK
ncbi:MAG: twin-arginine translocation signal domain-containing protein, partial [Verrucomicrobia bacterium]|nr:twin-arginine translocation signal domain-containing protein [Verrucomicrobiota bacterium]